MIAFGSYRIDIEDMDQNRMKNLKQGPKCKNIKVVRVTVGSAITSRTYLLPSIRGRNKIVAACS